MMAHVVRPLSFLVTPAFVNAGISANGVTYMSGALGVMSLVFFAWGNQAAWIIGLVLFYSSILLDAVDGNVARVKGSTSYLGKFLDGISDTLVGTLIPASIGWGLYLSTGNVLWFAIGAVNSFIILFVLFAQARLSFHREWVRTDHLQGKLMVAPPPDLEWTPSGPIIPTSFLNIYLYAGIVVATISGIRPYFLAGYAILAFMWGAVFLRNQYFIATRILNLPRRSRHAANEEHRSQQ